MANLEEKIKDLISYRYGSVPRFAEEVNIPASTIYTVLKNGINGSSVSTVLPMLAKLGIDSNWIVKNKLVDIENTGSDFVELPLYGSIAAGTPIEMLEIEDTQPVPTKMHEKYPDAFFLKVEGESMNRVLPNGCFALVNPCKEVDCNNKPYAVCVNGYDATIKRVRKLANGFQLIPDSDDPTYTTKTFNYNEEGTEQITIIGRVVYYVLPFDWEF